MTSWLYDIDVVHVRSAPISHEVRRRGYQWFVDVDDLPDFGPLGRIDPADHLGDPTQSIRANVDAFLNSQGVTAPGRITMLTSARSLGYVFNPLTLYWCHAHDGAVVAVVAEVHNTYQERHCYLLRPDDSGRAETEKAFFVSPFYPVDGFYRMSVPEPGERLTVTMTLHRPGGDPPFVASVRSTRRRVATRRSVLAAVITHPFETHAVRAAITRHGITLWAKRLPVQTRPKHAPPALVGRPRPEAPMSARNPVAPRLAALLRSAAGVELPVRLRAWDGSEAGPVGGPVLIIRHRRALRRLLWAPGELGLARAYVTGDLDVEGDLADGFRQAWTMGRTRAQSGVDLSATGTIKAALGVIRLGALGRPPKAPVSEARLSGGLHTKRRDRDAIAHHYDLSNDFYHLLLDDTMAYSSAYYERDDQPLVEAQRAKLDLICRKLGLRAGGRHLDVGCGWGSLILHAAEHYGVHATGVTLSAQQRDFVLKRVADRGLTDKVTVRLQDYRELPVADVFDSVSSIEMGEHVGQEQYPVYAATLFSHLKPTGRLLLQQMSRRVDAAPGGGAFIESYIAPDMHMRPVSQTIDFLERAGFEIRDVEAMREHYVRTVAAWIDTLEQNWPDVVALVGEEVARVWRLYLVGGALSFEEGRMGVDQILAVRASTDGISGMPHRRPWAATVE